MGKKLVIIRRKHIPDHGSDREFVLDVLEWTKEGTPFLVLPDDVEIIENKRRLGIMQFGCFEMQVLKKALKLALKMSEIIVPTEEMRFTSEEYEAAIVLLPRFSKKLEEKDC